MKTRILCKNIIIIFLISIGVLASLSQAFVSTYPEDIKEARNTFFNSKETRDKNREDAFKLLISLVNDSLKLSSEKEIILAKKLIEEHSINEKETIRLHEELKKVKKSNEIRGFKTLNSFLYGIGNPILIGIIGFLFLLMHLRRKKIDWEDLTKAYFLSASIICIAISLLYLTWGLVELKEIARYWYILIGVFCAFIIVGIAKLISKKIVVGRDQRADEVLNKFLKKDS